MVTLIHSKKWNELSSEVYNNRSLLNEVERIMQEMQAGKYHIEIPERLAQTNLGSSIRLLLQNLQNINQEEEKRSWASRGLSHFLDIFKNTSDLPVESMLDHVLSELVKYVKANQGAIFVLTEINNEPYLEMLACYAYERKKFINKTYTIGEGLVGQSFLDKEIIYLTDIPEGYVRITSGLGYSTPRNVLIAPLMINEEVVGVIELSSFGKLSLESRDFIRRIAESLASVIRSGREKKNLQQILTHSQSQTEELKVKEEQMRQNMEQMSILQDRLARNEIELKRRLTEMEEALQQEKSSEVAKIREEERGLLESKLETQKKMYEMIIEKLKSKLKETN